LKAKVNSKADNVNPRKRMKDFLCGLVLFIVIKIENIKIHFLVQGLLLQRQKPWMK